MHSHHVTEYDNRWSHLKAMRFLPLLAGRYFPTARRRTGKASFHLALPLAADLA